MKRRALVTGASEGIGRSFALKLAAVGFSVTAVARTESRLKELITELGANLGHDFGKMLNLNIETLTRLSHAFLKSAVKGDALINVSSMGSLLPMPYAAVYSGTKGYVTNFTECIYAENRAKDVYVMCLCPGATRTLFQTSSGGKDENMPAWATQTAEQVVAIAMRALKSRSKPVVRCGVQGWASYFMPLIPMKLYLRISERVLRRALAK